MAGTLCGSVKDGSSHGPVAGAGVFVFAGGVYAGRVAVTDAAGAFCIANLPAATYDLQIRVNDYVEKIVRGIVVEEDVSGVIVEVGSRVRLAEPQPNPARARVQLSFELAVTASVELQIFDVAGGLVQGWRSENLPAGSHSTLWTFRDRHDHVVPSGIYFVRLSTPWTRLTRRLVFLGR